MEPILIALAAAALAGLAILAGARGPQAIPVRVRRRNRRG